MKKKLLILEIFIVALSLALLSATAFAWINRAHVSGGAGFQAAGSPFMISQLSRTFAEENNTVIVTDGSWGDSFGNNSEVTPTVGADGAIEFNGINFGTIDNVNVLKEESKLYFRLTPQADNIAEGATTAVIKLTCTTDDYNIYDAHTGTPALITDRASTYYASINAIADLAFMECLTVTTTDDLSTTAALTTAFASAEGQKVWATADGLSIQLDNISLTSADYIYLCIQPDLHSYREIVKPLTAIMPCFLTFDLSLETYTMIPDTTA